jgi:hypothetical protein
MRIGIEHGIGDLDGAGNDEEVMGVLGEGRHGFGRRVDAGDGPGDDGGTTKRREGA